MIKTFQMQEELTSLWQEFCSTNGLPQISADDLLHQYDDTFTGDANNDLLNDEQLKFVTRFIDLWEVTV